MWVAIVGSRTFGECPKEQFHPGHLPPTPEEAKHATVCPEVTSRYVVMRAIAKWAQRPDFEGVVSGAAIGADSIAKEMCDLLGVAIKEVPVPSGPEPFRDRALGRNSVIVARADVLVAFFSPGQRSPGTSDSLRKAKAKGIPTYVFQSGRWTTE
jgi:hypothetical protein